MPTTAAKPKLARVRARRFNSTPSETWKMEDAKARLSEVVRRAGTNGPQLVTIRGKEAAVILAPEEYRQLLPKPKGQVPLVEFLRGLHLDQLDLTRECDTGREIDLL
jgi:prevent-host-death family protein